MPTPITRYSVFIACPQDVAPEKDAIIRLIADWNRRNSAREKVEFEPLYWNNGSILPDIEKDGQEEIDKKLLGKADLLLAIFWWRPGLKGTRVELAAFPGTKLVYFCSRDFNNSIDLALANEVKELKKEWFGKGRFIQEFTEIAELEDLVNQHLSIWISEQRKPLQALDKPDQMSAVMKTWVECQQVGTILLFNIELATFETEDDFFSTWDFVGKHDNIKRIVLVLPARKEERLLAYVKQYRDRFEAWPGADKFEVARTDQPPPAVAFGAFRIGEQPHQGPWHDTRILFVLSEPFSRMEKAENGGGLLWRYEVMVVSQGDDPVKPLLRTLLPRSMPARQRTSIKKLFARDEVGLPPDPDKLPGDRSQPAGLDLRLQIRDDLFFCNVPTYVLDTNYNLVDWNAAFDLLFGHLRFYRGQFVVEFLKHLVNSEEVIKRGKSFVKNPPLFDDEEFIFDSASFGRMRFLKTTAQALDEKGEYQGWNVALSLTEVFSDDYRKALREVVEYETLMGIYAPAYNRIMAVFPEYQKLVAAMAEAVGKASRVLDAGAGPGYLARHLAQQGASVVALDANDAMLACATENCATEILDGQVKVHKANLQSLTSAELCATGVEAFQPPFDAVVMLNVFYAILDKPRLLTTLHGMMAPGGRLILSGPKDDVTIYEVYSRLPVGGIDATDLRLFQVVNNTMFDRGLLKQSLEETQKLLTAAGFTVEETHTVFCNQGVMIVCRA